MPTLKQLTSKLPTLKELKAQFTDMTGIPTNKANVFTVCSGLGDRKMITKADWGKPVLEIEDITIESLKLDIETQQIVRDVIAPLAPEGVFTQVGKKYQRLEIANCNFQPRKLWRC